MRKINFILTLFLFAFFNLNYSQFIGERFNSYESELQYNRFQYSDYLLSDNPAWLVRDYKKEMINIASAFSAGYGDLRKEYSPERTHKFVTVASTLRDLKSAGIFYGKFNYTYELRKNNNKILTKRTYTGNPFFLRDNTTGNMKYSGPGILLGYSVNVTEKLSAGLKINYAVDDGLKDAYTFAESTNREIIINPGIAYNVTDDINLGVAYKFFSYKENIKIQDVNNLSVEIFRHRGDNVFVRTVSSDEEEKDITTENSFSFFSNMKISENIGIKLKADYVSGETRIIIPQSLLRDHEDGKEVYDAGAADILANIKLNKNFALDLGYNLYSRKSRSQNSNVKYLLWNWSSTAHTFGARLNYSSSKKLMLGLEAGYTTVKADSSKYIDSKFSKETSSDFYAGTFGTVQLNDKTGIEFQIRYLSKEKDFFLGADDLSGIKGLLAFDYQISEKIKIKPFMLYERNKAVEKNELLMFGIKLSIN